MNQCQLAKLAISRFEQVAMLQSKKALSLADNFHELPILWNQTRDQEQPRRSQICVPFYEAKRGRWNHPLLVE